MNIIVPRPLERSSPMPTWFGATTPPQWTEFVLRKPRAIAETAEKVRLTQRHADALRDLAMFGRRAYGPDRPKADHWDDEPPFVDGVQTPGFDCENLALYVRRMMDEEFEDWPLGAGRPAICTLSDGRAHCVLVAVTSNYGDLVVGTQAEEDLVPWESLKGYRWHKRLEAGSRWVLFPPAEVPMSSS